MLLSGIMCREVCNPVGSNIVVLDSEQLKVCSGNDEVTTMVYD
jgi:hypothetical protein